MNKPKHIAIMMDGNGRWAKNKGLERTEGHVKSEEVFRKTCQWLSERNIKYLTVFAFSTENWQRPQAEVKVIMSVLKKFFQYSSEIAKENNYKVCVIGNRNILSKDLNSAIDNMENETKDNGGLVVQIAINYGGRDEIVRAVNKYIMFEDAKQEYITEEKLGLYLDTKGIPEPDLLIRTGGEIRLSNFMLWQVAYSELYFTEVLWPDFNEDELENALEYYNTRNRRFGNIN